MAKADILIGTSGFSYKEWLGGFYPEKLPGAKMLEYYAERMPTVEINYTFRAMPKTAMLEGWAARTPATFRFALKAPQRITHFAKLRGVKETTDTFIERASVMGERLAPALFQLPPDLKIDLELLRDFLAILKGRIRAAFEFRNRSWFDKSVMTALADHRRRAVYRGNREARVAARADRAVRLRSLAQGDLRRRRAGPMGEESRSPRVRRRGSLRLFQTRDLRARPRRAPARKTGRVGVVLRFTPAGPCRARG